ncbi:MAG TPA: phosphatase PAP2 family protein [Blastocatellia bacterium]|nr:phosphatase PAP2 family protein [Blastocatellia bacterium]
MESIAAIRQRVQPWQLLLCAGVCGYLSLSAATHSLKTYHWFMLVVIPGAWLYRERMRRFFLDWAPMIAFWIVYDRLRLIQPLLLDRVIVEQAYNLERWAFGWMAAGDLPAHAGRAWLAALSGTAAGGFISWGAQLVYLSHIFIVPLLMLFWWHADRNRERFLRHVRAFTALHLLAISLYLLLPVAPPWWVSLHGFAPPSAELLAQTRMSDAMDGALVERMIKTASLWFAAVPSLHGAYPVLLLLLGLGERRRGVLVLLGIYAAAMWAATVILNQHYIIDLVAGAALATTAWLIFKPRSLSNLAPAPRR